MPVESAATKEKGTERVESEQIIATVNQQNQRPRLRSDFNVAERNVCLAQWRSTHIIDANRS